MFRRKKNKIDSFWEANLDDSEFYSAPSPNRLVPEGRTRKKNREDYREEYYESEENKRTQRAFWAVVLVAAYIGFVILGAVSTSYITDPFGNKEAQVITVALREEREFYRTLLGHLMVQQEILKKVYELDERLMTTQPQDYFALATSYQDILDQIDKYIVLAKAMAIPTRYGSLKSQIVDSYNNCAVYLQKIASALSNRDAETLAQALSWRLEAYNSYNRVRDNVATFATMVKIDPASMQAKPLSPFGDAPTFAASAPSATETETPEK